MSFILVVYALLLIALTTRTYKQLSSVILTTGALLSAAAALLVYGLNIFTTQDLWHVFGKDIDRSTFIHLMVVLFIFNIISSFFIVRSYREYREVNRSIHGKK